jgi:proteasome lid subunit RPN8/RPN11
MSGDISRAVLEQIFAHASQGYPEEVCGFIVGDDEVRRCENRQNILHTEDPEHFPRDASQAYNLGARDILFLERSLKSERPVRVIYHSHVEVGAYFSAEDVAAATWEGQPLYPTVDWLVVDVKHDGVGGALRFRFVDGAFVQIAAYAS